MGFDYVFSDHEVVAILIGIDVIIIFVAVYILRKDRHKDATTFITDMKKPKIRP